MSRSLRRFLTGGAVVALAIGGLGIWSRTQSQAELAQWTAEQAIPTVEVIHPQAGAKTQDVVLPGDVEAYFDAPIYARVSGYLKTWYRDIGAHVKAGELLAEIDTPDLDQQLSQAKADLAAAKANLALAEITAKRWQSLLVSDAVSRQEVDEKVGDAEAKKAIVAAADANVSRLEALEAFKRIVAPFDGVVTARKTDVGALINAGSGTGPELFSVSDVHKMRTYVRVPQALSADLHAGLKAEMFMPQFPNRPFPATVVTTSEAINQASRTLLVELDTDNPKGELNPGTYAEVHFQLKGNADVVRVPASALLFRAQGLQVATVGAENKVVLKSIVIARDLGNEVEVNGGLTAADQVINSPPDSIEQGDTVRVADAVLAERGAKTSPSGAGQ